MGNCLFGGLGVAEGVVKVITSNGGILEFNTPITAGSITNEFPSHALFPSQDLFWRPLSLQEELRGGQSYYLLPLNNSNIGGQIVREGHVRSKSIPSVAASSNIDASYRMSIDYQGALKRSYTEVFSRYSSLCRSNNGFWKVKLVISREQLGEILSQEARTEELIENVRAVAKCGNGFSSSSSSVEFSDSWSLSSSRNASCKKDSLVAI
ncbi:PLASTID MOVEMENT IMPAIRED PROTEIN-RELATED [Salix purpurea]|uniref:PLASTID MOVEMENT IMPAIRED PROTEIN-RELATED n=1 Tax=Salix purpurea TaxID=77065 RepID=A0A9Q0WNT7_SALPP|nr:PLASTID MOVEMENT IMPAIRED PROTEIN-RELATED [Salix purpurea]